MEREMLTEANTEKNDKARGRKGENLEDAMCGAGFKTENSDTRIRLGRKEITRMTSE